MHQTPIWAVTDSSDSDSTFTGASPWPPLVAIGFVLSEIGVLLGLRPVSVAGLLLFVVSVAGILTEAGYITDPAKGTGVQGLALISIGTLLITGNQIGTAIRGQSIVIAGIICLVGALLWAGFVRKKSRSKVSASQTSKTTSD
ncbi:DUF7541 family protein [Halobaculum saliterrae]